MRTLLLAQALLFSLLVLPTKAQQMEPDIQPRLMVQLGHTREVTSVAFSPDGQHVITGGYDETARLWDMVTGEELQRFEGGVGVVHSMVFSPDGQHLLTGSYDKTARLWSVETGEQIRRYEGHASAVTSVAFSPDGQHLLTGSRDDTARLWSVETGEEVQRFIGHTNGVWSVAFSPDNRHVLTGSWDGTARLWSVETGQEIRRYEGHADLVASVAFSPDGQQVITGSWDKTVRLWSVEQWPAPSDEPTGPLTITTPDALQAWQDASAIPLNTKGRAEKTFTVKLPRREGLEQVELSAYAFNLDRVKSATVRRTYQVPEELEPVKGRAYVITVGVTSTTDPYWSLDFASQDARLLGENLSAALQQTRAFETVVPVMLVTTPPGSPFASEEPSIQPTKANIEWEIGGWASCRTTRGCRSWWRRNRRRGRCRVMDCWPMRLRWRGWARAKQRETMER